MKHVAALMAALMLNAAANLMMKAGASQLAAGGETKAAAGTAAAVYGLVSGILSNPLLLIGLICFGLNAVCYMYALQSDALKISMAYPVMVGGGYTIIATVAYFALRERMTPFQWFGVALILAGVVMVASQTQTAPEKRTAMGREGALGAALHSPEERA